MEREGLATGALVWATMGGHGFREAVVEFPGYTRKHVPLMFTKKGRIVGHGKREPQQCFPRDPQKGGADKPTPRKKLADALNGRR